MTNTSNSASASNMGWEIAGGKKAVKKPVEVKSKGGAKEAVKFPKQETLRKSTKNTIKHL